MEWIYVSKHHSDITIENNLNNGMRRVNNTVSYIHFPIGNLEQNTQFYLICYEWNFTSIPNILILVKIR